MKFPSNLSMFCLWCLNFFSGRNFLYTTCIYVTSTVTNWNPFLFQCQTLNEEEIFEIQDRLSLFTLGWIHVSTCILSMASNCSLYFTCSFSLYASNFLKCWFHKNFEIFQWSYLFWVFISMPLFVSSKILHRLRLGVDVLYLYFWYPTGKKEKKKKRKKKKKKEAYSENDDCWKGQTLAWDQLVDYLTSVFLPLKPFLFFLWIFCWYLFWFFNHSVYYYFDLQTHPSQTCFMSSVDLHTHYSYQVTDGITWYMFPGFRCFSLSWRICW